MVKDPQIHTNPETGPITIHYTAASLARSAINRQKGTKVKRQGNPTLDTSTLKVL